MANDNKSLIATGLQMIGIVSCGVWAAYLYGKKKFAEGRRSYEQEVGNHPKRSAFKKILNEKKDNK